MTTYKVSKGHNRATGEKVLLAKNPETGERVFYGYLRTAEEYFDEPFITKL